MLGATKKCQADSCNRMACANCFCCDKNVCRRHFMEHTDDIKAQIDPLARNTNEMVEKIRGLTIEKITDSSFAQLQQWKTDMHQLIDEMVAAKTKEMENLIAANKQKFEEHQKQQFEIVVKIQDEVNKLVDDSDVTFEQIQSLKTQLADVQANLDHFAKNFLLLYTTKTVHGLVTFSTNVNTPMFNFPSSFGKFLLLDIFTEK